MPWYVVQTYTGQEEKLIGMLRRMDPEGELGHWFTMYYEMIWRSQTHNEVHLLRSFPGYIFAVADDIVKMTTLMRKAPAMTKTLMDGEDLFLPILPDEQRFLESVSDKEHVIRLSYIVPDNRGGIMYAAGPINGCEGRVSELQLSRRYARVRTSIGGAEKEFKLGIILSGDIRREIAFGKVEKPGTESGVYEPFMSGAGSDADEDTPEAEEYSAGEEVAVTGGTFAGTAAKVVGAGRNTVKIEVRLFGREMAVEVPVSDIAHRTG